MKINKIILGLLCAAQSLYGMQGVKECIDEAVNIIRKNYNYDAALVPEGFDEMNCGKIMYYDGCARTPIGNVYHYDTTIQNGTPIGWHCVHQKDPNITPNDFEQFFNTAELWWQQTIRSCILGNLYPNFIYNKPTQTCIFSLIKKDHFKKITSNPKFYHNQLVIEQNRKKQNINIDLKGHFSTIKAITCSNDGQYCAYANIRSPKKDAPNNKQKAFIKILKRSPVDFLYDSFDDDMLTKGDNAVTKEFQLIEANSCIHFQNLHFFADKSMQVHTIIEDDAVYLWTINPKGIKRKHECLVDLGDNQLLSLSRLYSLPTWYKKIVKSCYRYHINDLRFLTFIKSDFVQTNKDVGREIIKNWYKTDEKLREHTKILYNCKNLSEKEKTKIEKYFGFMFGKIYK